MISFAVLNNHYKLKKFTGQTGQDKKNHGSDGSRKKPSRVRRVADFFHGPGRVGSSPKFGGPGRVGSGRPRKSHGPGRVGSKFPL